MEFNKKFNVLATIASLLLIVNFFFTDMSTTSILSAILSLVVVIGYAMYQNKNFYAKLEEKFGKLENSIDDIEKTYKMTRNSLETVSSKSEVEEDKVAEIDDALENTSTMVIRNKENTRQASQLTQAVITAIDNGNAEMQVMMGSVNEIKTLSGEIQKIIKVINDIAFQTNILALNAAVEAARAGDAGKGFAVVADEVRNLAQKSAEAVNSTTQIIESNLIAAENSVEISAKVEEALIRTSEEAKKVEELINEIAASSEEQATEVLRTKTLANGLDSIVKESNGAKDNNMQNIEKLSEKIFDLNEIVKNFDAERDNEVKLEKVNTPLTKSTKKVEEDKKVSTFNVESKIKKEDKTLNIKKSEIKVEPKIETKVESKFENIKKTDVKKDEKLEKEKVEDNMTFDDNKASKDSNEEKLDVKEEKFDKSAFEKAKEEINNKKAAGKRITRADAEMILPLDDTDGF